MAEEIAYLELSPTPQSHTSARKTLSINGVRLTPLSGVANNDIKRSDSFSLSLVFWLQNVVMTTRNLSSQGGIYFSLKPITEFQQTTGALEYKHSTRMYWGLKDQCIRSLRWMLRLNV